MRLPTADQLAQRCIFKRIKRMQLFLLNLNALNLFYYHVPIVIFCHTPCTDSKKMSHAAMYQYL